MKTQRTQMGFWTFAGIFLVSFYALGSLLFAGQIKSSVENQPISSSCDLAQKNAK